MQDVKIYVCCHKDYNDVGIDNSCYKLITKNNIKNNSKLNIIKIDKSLDDRMWSELSAIYYIWKHQELHADWIGFNHYRRYFDFMNVVPQQLIKPIIPEHSTLFFNNYAMYDVCHNSADLRRVLNIVATKYQKYYNGFMSMLDSHILYSYNMFVLPLDIFKEYCEFIFGVLGEFDKELNINNDYESMLKHIANYREAYVERDNYPNNTYEYQARVFGFLAERLTTAFFMNYMINFGQNAVEEHKIIVTEKTYNVM